MWDAWTLLVFTNSRFSLQPSKRCYLLSELALRAEPSQQFEQGTYRQVRSQVGETVLLKNSILNKSTFGHRHKSATELSLNAPKKCKQPSTKQAALIKYRQGKSSSSLTCSLSLIHCTKTHSNPTPAAFRHLYNTRDTIIPRTRTCSN